MRRLVIVLPSILLVAGCVSLNPNDHTHPGQVALGSDGYTVTAEFADVQNVVPNSTVQRDNVVIGTVTKIRVENWTARVTMRLLKSVRLPSSSTFRIGQKTLLGAQYIEVSGADQNPQILNDGAMIPLAATGTYPETEQVLASVSLLLNNGGLSQISTITGELNQALAGRVPNTRILVTRLNRLLSTLDSRKEDLVRLLDVADSLAATVADQEERVEEAVDSIGPGLTVVAKERHELVEAIADLGRLSRSAGSVVSTSRTAFLANLRQLEPVLRQLAKAGSNLANALKLLLTAPFPVNTTMNAIRGDYMNLFTTFDVSLQALSEAFLGAGLPLAPPTLDADSPDSEGATEADEGQRRSGVGPAPSAEPTGSPTAAPAPAPAPKDTACSLIRSILGGC